MNFASSLSRVPQEGLVESLYSKTTMSKELKQLCLKARPSDAADIHPLTLDELKAFFLQQKNENPSKFKHMMAAHENLDAPQKDYEAKVEHEVGNPAEMPEVPIAAGPDEDDLTLAARVFRKADTSRDHRLEKTELAKLACKGEVSP